MSAGDGAERGEDPEPSSGLMPSAEADSKKSGSLARVSVVVAAHTRIRYLKQAVRSVVAQQPEEIIVVKYGREPELDADLAALGARVHVTQERYQGGKLADGLEVATGDVVAFLDDDDVFLPGKIARVREVFADPRVIFHGHRYTPFRDIPPQRGTSGLLRLFETGQGNQYWEGLKPVVASCASVRREALLPSLSALRQTTVADHAVFMLAVVARKWMAMDQSVLTGYHRVVADGTQRSSSSLWQEPQASASGDISWMLDMLDSESGGVRRTLTPMVVSAVIHLVFVSGETEFHEYRRTMRALLDGVGVRRPLAVMFVLMFGYPLSPRGTLALYRTWKALAGDAEPRG